MKMASERNHKMEPNRTNTCEELDTSYPLQSFAHLLSGTGASLLASHSSCTIPAHGTNLHNLNPLALPGTA